ncbi:MAG: hypothetical protein DWQ34_00150 [Planctomycetota bacterium]|nr:MAG: hypothetical protein DWQ29_17130 [Planctomycetota bacterium]REJ98436.1 MAG: hypothetical protein DWQ34_00150 [Planctomycetota bacterium]REK23649.1 MAG: hypothetical protein DWQ41_16575 [Planctomycetota bacterium]REK31124.1 MAG: hypothetical protein DWQ45_19955 [Planctomycetota bacterium]
MQDNKILHASSTGRGAVSYTQLGLGPAPRNRAQGIFEQDTDFGGFDGSTRISRGIPQEAAATRPH